MSTLSTSHEPPDHDRHALRRYARDGDPEAFLTLVRRYEAMVLATCRRTLPNGTDAEDAAQETFLKLAQHANTVRSNVAAWLHRCAIGTSIDLLRRETTHRRAAQQAATQSTDSAERPNVQEPTWADLEPRIDRALEQLSTADRQLIVARYLAGRSQVELAHEAGVSEGTISRRLSRAVERLRTALAIGGLAVAPAGLTGVLGRYAPSAVPEQFGPALGKIALAGAPRRTAATALPLIAAAIPLVIGAIAIPRLASQAPAPQAGAIPIQQPATVELGPPPPDGTIGPFQTVSTSDRSFKLRGIFISNQGLSIRHGLTDNGDQRIAMLDLISIVGTPDDPDTPNLTERAVLEARVAAIRPPGEKYNRFKSGQRLTIEYGVDHLGRIVLHEPTGEIQLGRNEPRWFGIRPPIGWPEYGRIPEDAGEHDLLGPWVEAERIPVTITAEEIRFGTDVWSSARYRVIDWEQRDGWSRVLSVQAGGRDPRLIATRFRLLLRRDDAGYSIAYFPPGTPRAGRWPSSFDYTVANPVRVISFVEDE